MRTLVTALAASLTFVGAAQAAPLPPSGTLDLGAGADMTFGGAAPGDATGWAVARAGDVNGDGRPDFAISAPLADPGGRENAGSVYVVFGGGTIERSLGLGALGARGYRIDGAQAGDRLGRSVDDAGDVDGDGRADLVIGAPASGTDRAGAAFVVTGRATPDTVDLSTATAGVARIDGAAPGDELGSDVAGVGDYDGDGVPDVIAGAPAADPGGRRDGGSAFVALLARPLANLKAGDARVLRLDGPEAGRAGSSVGAVGDLSGDGRPELLVGAPLAQARGLAYVVHSRPGTAAIDLNGLGASGQTLVGDPGEGAGLSVTGLPDLNGDGLPEIGVGGPFADRNGRPDSGGARVVFGDSRTGVRELASVGAAGLRIDGALAGDAAGGELDGVGDVNADGRPDLLVTATFADPLGRKDAGAAYVLFAGAPGERIDLGGLGARGVRYAGAVGDDYVRSAAGVGDVDADGTPDVLVGELDGLGAAAGDQDRRGAAHLVLGPRPVPPAEVPPPDPGQQAEVAAGCVAADNIELVLDDSGSMVQSDAENLRAEAVQLLLSKPRNDGRVVGAIEFGTRADPIFPPQPVHATGTRANVTELRGLLDEAIGADAGATNYNAAFAALAQENPGAKARIFLTDGAHTVGKYGPAHRGGPPTYVIGLGVGRGGPAGDRLAKIARETGGKYFPRVTAEQLQAVVNAIDADLNCDRDLDTFVDTLTAQEDEAEANEVELEQGVGAVDVSATWSDPDDELEPGDIELLDSDGEVVRTLPGRRLGTISAAGGTATIGDLTVTGRRSRTFFTIRIAGPLAAKVRFTVRARTVAGRSARVRAQVAQSRRTR